MKISILSIFCLFFLSCSLFEYHPYDGKTDAVKDINKTNIARIVQATEGKDTLRFIMMGDSQRWYDETEDFVSHVNSQEPVDFVIHGGDISDFGLVKEFTWIHDIMSKLTAPYVAIIGNHDIIGNGDKVFKSMYGDENFSFIASDVKFVCLNTNSLEYEGTHPVPDLNYMLKELTDSLDHERTIVAMHAPPDSEQMNSGMGFTMQQYIKRFKGLMFCLNAHNHNTQIRDIFNDGVLYYGCTAMKKRGYFVFEITKDSYSYEEMFF